jgi:hypothetical protein
MIDNQDVAIFSKVNDLAKQWGLKPYDFVATVRPTEEPTRSILSFEVPAQGNALREERFSKMLHAIGADLSTGTLEGTPMHIIDALDEALRHAPRKRF